MRKSLIVAALVSIGYLGCAYAQSGGFQGPGSTPTATQGGFEGPRAEMTVTSAEQAKTLRDNTRVMLQGYIIQHLGSDNYLFKDDSGTISVDIDHDKWAGQTVKPTDLVEIRGEVDKGFNSVEIDVKSIRIVR